MKAPKITLIRGGKVVTGESVSKQDLLIRGEIIAESNDLSGCRADLEIDAEALHLGESLHLSDIPLPEGVEIVALTHVEETEHDDLPVPRAINEPGTIQGDFGQRIRDILNE